MAHREPAETTSARLAPRRLRSSCTIPRSPWAWCILLSPSHHHKCSLLPYYHLSCWSDTAKGVLEAHCVMQATSSALPYLAQSSHLFPISCCFTSNALVLDHLRPAMCFLKLRRLHYPRTRLHGTC